MTITTFKKRIIFLATFLITSIIVYFFFNRDKIQEGLNEEYTIPTIPDGFYKINETKMKKTPYGFKVNPTKDGIVPLTQTASYSEESKKNDGEPEPVATGTPPPTTPTYNPTVSNSDMPYHTETGVSESGSANSSGQLGNHYMFDSQGNLIEVEITDMSFSPILYYIPGSYKYGSSNYVPNYEDSVYLSRTTRQSTVAPVYNTASQLGGFCNQYKGNKYQLDEKCGALDLNACASTSCCVLLGGQKCVGGSKRGPTNVANYTDYNLHNKDFYYYQGKCYGNCN